MKTKALEELFSRAGQNNEAKGQATTYAYSNIVRIQQQRDELADILRELHDFQNGPPLIRYKLRWLAAMQRAEKLLPEIEKEMEQ